MDKRTEETEWENIPYFRQPRHQEPEAELHEILRADNDADVYQVDKQKIYLNHYPFLCYGGSYDDTWQLFGHVHTRRNNTGKDASRLSMLLPTQYDVGVDNNDFTPVSFAQVKAIIGKQIEQSKKGEQ